VKKCWNNEMYFLKQKAGTICFGFFYASPKLIIETKQIALY